VGELGRSVRVGLVHPMRTWLQALAGVLAPLADVDVVVSHAEPRWVRNAVARGEVDVVVMRVTADSGATDVVEMRQARSDVGVVVIGDHAGSAFLAGLVRAGARGYVAEDCSLEELHGAVLSVADGDTWLSPAHLTLLIHGLLSSVPTGKDQDDRLLVLSEREREILDCLAQGMRREEIADRLFISPNTVRTHINHLIKKLKVHSALAAVSIAKGAGQSLPMDAQGGQRVPGPRLPDEAEAVNRQREE
jgi:DNA-binding NarL/FixJ family response regulator